MKRLPIIDKTFDLRKALEVDGFTIDEHEEESFAHGFTYDRYGEIWVVFNASFLDNSRFCYDDMRVYYYNNSLDRPQVNLYKGLMPTNQHDYDTLMQLLFPSDEFKRLVETKDNK